MERHPYFDGVETGDSAIVHLANGGEGEKGEMEEVIGLIFLSLSLFFSLFALFFVEALFCMDGFRGVGLFYYYYYYFL